MNKCGYGGKPCPFKIELTGRHNKWTYVRGKKNHRSKRFPEDLSADVGGS